MVYLEWTIVHISRVAVVLVTAEAMVRVVVVVRVVVRATGADASYKHLAISEVVALIKKLLQALRIKCALMSSWIRVGGRG